MKGAEGGYDVKLEVQKFEFEKMRYEEKQERRMKYEAEIIRC
jgi:hypothetical protein